MEKEQLENYERLNIYAGWSWLCDYHNTYGLADTKHEALWMAGAHMHYFESHGDHCDIFIKSHNKRGRKRTKKITI